jgi:hypothetical protein
MAISLRLCSTMWKPVCVSVLRGGNQFALVSYVVAGSFCDCQRWWGRERPPLEMREGA